MTNRASLTGQIGGTAQSAVQTALAKMGLGPAPVPQEYDTGTDFWVQVRDRERFELGLLLGVQVKAEKSYFVESAVTKALSATPPHWEYRADPDKAKAWADHAVPHILALHDSESEKTYWGAVTHESIRWTDKGAYIKVPCANVLCRDTLDELIQYAACARAGNAWSGNSWKNLEEYDPSVRLRMALVVPTLAARHGNRSQEALLVEEMIAMVVKGDYRSVARSSETVALLEGAETDGMSWRKRLLHRIYTYLRDGDVEPLLRLVELAESSSDLAAAYSVCVAALLEQGKSASARRILNGCDLEKFDDHVDRSWVALQMARCLIEDGDVAEGERIALENSSIGVLYPFDITAISLRASALGMISPFSQSGSSSERNYLEDLIGAIDAPHAWLRGQQRASALSRTQDANFALWCSDDASSEDEIMQAQHTLRGLMLSTGFAADRSSWTVAAHQYAQFVLTSSELVEISEENVAGCLSLLQLTGAKDDLQGAVDRILEQGPLGALQTALFETDLATSYGSHLTANIEFIRSTSEVVSTVQAENFARYALSLLREEESLPVASLVPWALRDSLAKMIVVLWRALSSELQDQVTDFALSFEATQDETMIRLIDRFYAGLPADAWSPSQLETMRQRLGIGSPNLEDTFPSEWAESWSATLVRLGDHRALEMADAALAAGDASAMSRIRIFKMLSPSAAGVLRDSYVQNINQTKEEYSRGCISYRGTNDLVNLFLLNITLSEFSDWETLIEAISDQYPREFLGQLLEQIVEDFESIPTDVVPRVHRNILALSDEPSRVSFFQTSKRFAALKKEASLLLMNPFESQEALAQVMLEGIPGRLAMALRIESAPSELQLPLLLMIGQEPNVRARSSAAKGFVRLLCRDGSELQVQRALAELVSSNGEAVHRAVLQQLVDSHARVDHPGWDLVEASPFRYIRESARTLRENFPY